MKQDHHTHDHADVHESGHGHERHDPAHHHGDDHAHDHHESHGAHGDGHGHDHPGGLKGFLLSIVKPHSHDAADSVDEALESNAEGIRALKISLLALLITAVLQLIVVLITGSVALLADTIHNFSDALTAIPLWIAFVLARRPATKRFTYGYGRFEDLAGLFIVLMIALSAVVAGYQSIVRLIEPQDLSHVWVVFAAGLIGFAGNELVAVYRIRVGRKIGSAALVADGLHARTDGFTSLAVAIGAIGVLLGFPLADPIVGLLIAIAILFVLKSAARDIYRRLMDGIEPETVAIAEAAVRAVPGVIDVTELRMRWLGHTIRAEVGLTVNLKLDLLRAEEIARQTEHALRRDVPKLTHATVQVSASQHVSHTSMVSEHR
jgi:cation diffusion facilitator family transporter